VNICKRGPVVTGRELLITSLQLATIALSAYQAHVETFQSHQ